MSDLQSIMNHPHDSRNPPPGYPHPPPYASSSQHSAAPPEFTSLPTYPAPSTWSTPFASRAPVPATPPTHNHAVAHHVAGDFNVNSVVSISSPPRPPRTGASTPSQSAGSIGMDAGPTTGSKHPRTYSDTGDHREMPAPGLHTGHVDVLAADMQLNDRNKSRLTSYCKVSLN